MLKTLKKFIFNICSIITFCLVLTYYSVIVALPPLESCNVSLQCNVYDTISCSVINIVLPQYHKVGYSVILLSINVHQVKWPKLLGEIYHDIYQKNIAKVLMITSIFVSSISIMLTAETARYCSAFIMCKDGTGRACYGLEFCASFPEDNVTCDGIVLSCRDPW